MPALWQVQERFPTLFCVSLWDASGFDSRKGVNSNEDPRVYAVCSIEADHVVHAFDARTGLTLWKRVYPLAAINFSKFNKNGGQLTPCVKDGRVYAQDTGCNLYCMDAATGRTLWKSDLGPRYRLQESIREYLLATGVMFGGRDVLVEHTAVAGTVVCTTGYESFKGTGGFFYEHKNTLHAFDRFTGKPRWAIVDVGASSPTVWRHADKEYFISNTSTKGTICVDVETGNIRWSVPGGVRTVPIGGDYMLLNGENNKLWCYRMTPDAATKLWEAPAECMSHDFDTAPVTETHAYIGAGLNCVELATGKVAGKLGRGGCASVVGGKRLISWADLGHMLPGAFYANADPDDYRVLNNMSLPVAAPYTSSLTYPLVDGRFFVRLTDRLACYDLRSAKSAKNRAHKSLLTGSPVLLDPPFPMDRVRDPAALTKSNVADVPSLDGEDPAKPAVKQKPEVSKKKPVEDELNLDTVPDKKPSLDLGL